jgi:SAM-dependent methyltransferase
MAAWLAAVADGVLRGAPPEIYRMTPASQHQGEIERNRRSWEGKPLLREIYEGFYRLILGQIDSGIDAPVVEIGAGIGSLKARLPSVIATDLFVNPGVDVVCDAYELPFASASVGHLVLFDVFHHLAAPNAFLGEARRVLLPRGRLILFEPYISAGSLPVYGLFHHEPVAWGRAINLDTSVARPRGYYAAQGNATRLFFWREVPGWPEGWRILRAEAFSCFHYLLSGGYSRGALYPAGMLTSMRALDAALSRWPRLFGGRCLVVLQPDEANATR